MTFVQSTAVRVIAAATAVSVALIGAGQPAVAATTSISGSTHTVSPSAIDVSARGSLTVKKQAPNPYDAPSAHPVSADIANRHLRLVRLNTPDITTTAGWDLAAAMDIAKATEADVDHVYQATTNAEGVAVFSDLRPGVYVLGEEQPTDTSRAYYATVPIVFTLPLADGEAQLWRYDVEIDSKDQLIPAPGTKPREDNTSGSSVSGALIPVVIGGMVLGSALSGATLSAGPVPTASAPMTSSQAPMPTTTTTTNEPLQPEDPSPRPSLPVTGANVIIAGGIGVVLMLAGLGVVLMSLRRSQND